ncbi:ABC transporter ATP-binding protein [Kocuria flava]|uniref:ABC transporter ATP-binding protein n=1 Tax=Kocuria flava TaxID=446860 RepID=UPI001FF3DC1B|nr:ABC transporter ATP-binding protein [Kocuria flava]MCJ8503765.1 ABC transporter ATP-binding protein [Kocuria flava]
MSSPLPVAGSRLQARELSLGYDGNTVVEDLSLAIPDGKITTIIGPNGCGKSTLLRGLARLLPPLGGAVTLDGVPLTRSSTRRIAQQLALLPQTHTAPEGLTVADLVSRGRHPRQRWYQQFSHTDEHAVHQALEATGITELADTPVDELSGGQSQRAWIAMTLVQDTDIVLLDEPTTYLDLAHQVEILQLIHRLNRDLGRTVVMVLHDISLAARFSDHIVAMTAGHITAQGTPAEVVTEDLLAEVFGLRAHIVAEPTTGRPHVIPLARIPATG